MCQFIFSVGRNVEVINICAAGAGVGRRVSAARSDRKRRARCSREGAVDKGAFTAQLLPGVWRGLRHAAAGQSDDHVPGRRPLRRIFGPLKSSSSLAAPAALLLVT